jgi:hypothetical protein
MDCPAGEEYKQFLNERLEKEAQTLAKLTGWDIQEIREKANITASEPTPWWQNLWSP